VAFHFIGNPAIIGGEDKNAAAEEQKRVYMRYAAFKPEERLVKMPKLRIEEIEEEEVVIVDASQRRRESQRLNRKNFPN
jgi:hypothetical protein